MAAAAATLASATGMSVNDCMKILSQKAESLGYENVIDAINASPAAMAVLAAIADRQKKEAVKKKFSDRPNCAGCGGSLGSCPRGTAIMANPCEKKGVCHVWNEDQNDFEVKNIDGISEGAHLCQECEKKMVLKAETAQENYEWVIATPSVMNLMEAGVITQDQALTIKKDVQPKMPNTSKKQKKVKVAGTKEDGRKTRTTLDHPHTMEEGDVVEHKYKGFTAKAIYDGNDQVRYKGEKKGLSGFCQAHVEYLLEKGKIDKGSTSWNGWAVCNRPGKKKGVWN